MRFFLFAFLFANTIAFAQEKFEIKNTSKNYDVKIEVAKCDDGFCEGAGVFSFYKKGGIKPFQIIKLDSTKIWLDKNGQAQADVTLLYDAQSAVNFGDFNFDGLEDIALCDGNNGNYNMPSYQIYLFFQRRQKFVQSHSFTKLGQGYLGMFQVDRKKKLLRTFNKSTCCEHYLEEYKVVNNRPRKVKEINEYYNLKGNNMIVTETKKTY